MKRPKVAIINETPQGKRHLINILNEDIRDETGINFDITVAENLSNPESLRKNSRLLRGHLYFIHEDADDKHLASRIAKVLTEKGVEGGKVLTTDRQEPYKDTMTTPGYEHFSGWLPKDTNQEFNIGEVIRKVQELRKDTRLSQPLSIGIVGLGILGLGILEKAVKSPSISIAHVYTNFVRGDYSKLLAWLDLTPGERDKITDHGINLEGVVQAEPDILLITTGKHGVDYHAYKDRIELTEMLFKTGIQKIDPVLRAVLEHDYKGLIAMQSNPNGHFIRYARNLGLPREQFTSFPPDTVRHRAGLYEYLKQIDPNIKESDVDLIAIGEHMRGGTPLYQKSTVKGKPLVEAYPQLQNPDERARICQESRKKGLEVMQSAEQYRHDYRGVPDRVKECLEDISNLRQYSRYPIYAGLLSVPAEFVYENVDNEDSVNIRVRRTCSLPELATDKQILLELGNDVKAIRKQTTEWQKAS